MTLVEENYVRRNTARLDCRGHKQCKMKKALWIPQTYRSRKLAKKTNQLQAYEYTLLHEKGRMIRRVWRRIQKVEPRTMEN